MHDPACLNVVTVGIIIQPASLCPAGWPGSIGNRWSLSQEYAGYNKALLFSWRYDMNLNNLSEKQKILNNISVKMRIIIISSVLWIVGCLIKIDPWFRGYYDSSDRGSRGSRGFVSTGHSHWGDFFLIGVLPLIIAWGAYWIIQGIKCEKNK